MTHGDILSLTSLNFHKLQSIHLREAVCLVTAPRIPRQLCLSSATEITRPAEPKMFPSLPLVGKVCRPCKVVDGSRAVSQGLTISKSPLTHSLLLFLFGRVAWLEASNPCPLHWKLGVLTTGLTTTREFPQYIHLSVPVLLPFFFFFFFLGFHSFPAFKLCLKLNTNIFWV